MKVWIKTLLKANTRVNKPMVTRKTECNYLKGASRTGKSPCGSHYFLLLKFSYHYAPATFVSSTTKENPLKDNIFVLKETYILIEN